MGGSAYPQVANNLQVIIAKSTAGQVTPEILGEIRPAIPVSFK